MPIEQLIQHVRQFGWDETLLRAARLAALLANGHDAPGGPVWTTTHASLISLGESPDRNTRRLAQYVAANPHRRIAHESAIHFIEAAALLYGAVGGPAPSDSALSLLLLAANDYCTEWRLPDDPTLTRRESNLVNLARASIHDDSSMGVLKLVRSRLLYAPPPPVGPLGEASAWRKLQNEAFDLPFDEYIESLAGPLAFLVGGLLSDPTDPEHPYPIVEPSLWFVARPDSKGFAEQLRLTREDAQRRIGTTPDGLPVGPSIFHHLPLVEILPDKLVVASPWALREVLNAGIWARHMLAAKRLYGDKVGADIWSAAFGYLVEGWCQKVAEWAARAPQFKGTVVTPTVPGEEDVEDVVIVDRMNVVLFSVKARLLREEVLKGARSDRGVLDWLDKFLFEKKAGSYRAGAIGQLNRKIDRLRSGEYSPRIHRDALVMPVLVTYENMGTDNPSITPWIAHRCREERLLQQSRVRPLTIINVDLFEKLLGVAVHGHRVTDILKKKTKPPWLAARLEALLQETIRQGEFGAVPELVQAYVEITNRMQANILPRPAVGT